MTKLEIARLATEPLTTADCLIVLLPLIVGSALAGALYLLWVETRRLRYARLRLTAARRHGEAAELARILRGR